MHELAPLTVVSSMAEAEFVRGLLQSDGIACATRTTDLGAGALGPTGGAGPVEVLVVPADLERARELLGAVDEP